MALPSRDQKIALAASFAAGLSCVVVFVFIEGVTTQAGWCGQPKEETLLKCFRDWANATGNVMTVAVAAVAAYFAYGSFVSARRQADIAALPLQTDRMSKLRDVLRLLIAINGYVATISFLSSQIVIGQKFKQIGDRAQIGSGYYEKFGELAVDLEKAGREIDHTFWNGGLEASDRLALEESISAAAYTAKVCRELLDDYDPDVQTDETVILSKGVLKRMDALTEVANGNSELMMRAEEMVRTRVDRLSEIREMVLAQQEYR